MGNSKTIGDHIREMAIRDFIMSGGIACKFVSKLPVGGCRFDVRNDHYRGYLLYDLDTELFAGPDGKWEERVKDILLDGEDVNFPTGEDAGICPFFPYNSKVLSLLSERDEIMLVPCNSHESRIDGNLYICQKFNWEWAVGIKSKSGKLLVNQKYTTAINYKDL